MAVLYSTQNNCWRTHVCVCVRIEKKSESDVTYDQVWWPILGICALHLTHPKCTHTAVNTHTPWTHTQSSGQPFMLRRPGSSWGFGALLKGTSVVVLRVERERCTFTPPTYNSCWPETRTPFDYESDSLTIRPGLPMTCKPYYDFHFSLVDWCFAKAMVYNTTLEIYVVLIFLVHYETVVQQIRCN